MTRDEIMQMARQCFISAEHEVLEHEALEFAYRVAQKEREACEQIGQTLKIPAGACAVSGHAWDSATIEYMRAIRARGQK